jgi:diaminopimelate epimerase
VPLRFSKVHGTGNDYVVVNTADGGADWPAVARSVCRCRLGVGADGLVVIGHRGGARFTVRCYNPDGSESSVSGNALRCCVLVIERRYGYRAATLRMCGEDHLAEVGPDGIGVAFPTVGAVRGPARSIAGPVYSIWVGGQHAVVPVGSVDRVDVVKMGAPLRHDPRFGVAGSNVVFAQAIGRSRLRLRSYERGVERETLSTGAGAVGAVMVGRHLGIIDPGPVSAEMPGGVLLVTGGPPDEVWLHGAASVVFDGEMDWGENGTEPGGRRGPNGRAMMATIPAP